jgi:hypothetical protein
MSVLELATPTATITIITTTTTTITTITTSSGIKVLDEP